MGGVGRIKPRMYDNQGGARFKQQIFMGNFTGNINQVLRRLMEDRFKENTYDLTYQNCNHFSDSFCKSLCGKGIPGWINSAADVNNAVQSAYTEASGLCCPEYSISQIAYSAIEAHGSSMSNQSTLNKISDCLKTFCYGFLSCTSSQLSLFFLEGKISWKDIVASASVVLIITSLGAFIVDLFTLQWTAALLDFFFFLSGIVTLGFEFKHTMIPTFMLNYVREELKIMCTPVGRAMVYIVLGLLLTTQQSSGYIYTWIGYFEMVAGFFLYVSAKSAGIKLNEIKSAGISDQRLSALFDKYDVGRKNYLESHEVQKLCEELGHPMDGIKCFGSTLPFTAFGELETATSILDGNNDGKVRFAEMSVWYVS